jgi:uncharacterized repeat protein (TIGR03803 family)
MSKTFKLIIPVMAAVAFAIGISGDVLAKTKAKLTVLHSFAGGADGATPYSTLVRDAKGNLYGTTLAGGSANLGTVFRINKKGVETVLHTFTGGSDGANPYAGVIFGADGALYGTTYHGGSSGLGTVYKITTSGSETVLHAFQGIFNNHDGSFPYGGLVLASDGNMWGTTVNGGSQSDYGTIYGLEPDGVVTVLYEFGANGGSKDALHPYSNLIKSSFGGNEYLVGTASAGGPLGAGTIYSFLPSLEEAVGSYMPGSFDSDTPIGGLVIWTQESNDVETLGAAPKGGLYGLGTLFEGDASCCEYAATVHSFKGINVQDGSFPYAALYHAQDGIYYGTTLKGGNSSDSGTIYSFAYTGHDTETPIYRFSGSDGSQPYGGLIEGKPGTFYGTTSSGGANNLGVVYKLVVK